MIKFDNISGQLNPSNMDSVYVCEQNNLEIVKNEYIAIVGESGSGKTQLMKILAGVNEDYFKLTDGILNYNFDQQGKITFDSGINTEHIPYSEITKIFINNKIYGERIGMMFQNPSTSFNPFWTVGRHFDEIQKIYQGIGNEEEFIIFKNHILHTLFKETRSDDVMRQFINKKPKNLSGGQKQRLIIALVIVRKPDLIIGDEIGTGIDLKIKKDIYNLLLNFRSGEEYEGWQPSLILISHDIGFAYKIVDKIFIMYRGTIVQKLNLISQDNQEKIPISNLLNDKKTILHPYTRALLASVISRTFSLVDVNPPNLSIRNNASCSYHKVCSYKPEDVEKCDNVFVNERAVNKDNIIRCVHSNTGLAYDQIEYTDYDWQRGWEHLERENNPVILEVKMNGHKIKQTDILHPYENVIQLRKNEILGLVGESGSGKTTLGKIIAGYPEYSAQIGSEITYFNETGQAYDYTDYMVREKLKYPIQIIHQDPQFSLNPNMTVKESLLEAIKIGLVKILGKYNSTDVNKSLNKCCNALAFDTKLLYKKIKTLSGGQQRRLGIGRVFALKPRVIIADEPVASLDSIIKNGIFQLFTYDDIHKLGFLLDNDEFTDTAMVLISHDLKSIDRYCSRMLVMEKGFIREEVPNHLGPGFKAKEEYTKELYANFQFFDLPYSEISKQ